MGRIRPFVKTYIIIIFIFFMSMTLVYCIPASWIREHVEQSIAVMEEEGERPVYFFHRHSAIIDNHTDILMYESLITNRDTYNVVQAAMSINQYPRYWHGYQVVLRPLSLIFQVQEVRYLSMLFFHILFFWSAWLIAKKTRLLNAILYVISVSSAYVVFLPVCLQYAATCYVLFASLIIMLSRYGEGKPTRWMLFFFVVGMMENFFDFLTYPIVTLGIPLILMLWLRVRDEHADFKNNFYYMIRASVSWGMGYALTWIAKWILAAAILGIRYFWRTMAVVQYRLQGSEEDPLDRIGTIQRNLKAWLNVQDGGIITWSKVAILIFVVALLLAAWRKLKEKREAAAYLPILFVALYPYIWYLVMSNHSQIHFWYTYRAQIVALFGGLMFIGSVLRGKETGQ